MLLIALIATGIEVMSETVMIDHKAVENTHDKRKKESTSGFDFNFRGLIQVLQAYAIVG